MHLSMALSRCAAHVAHTQREPGVRQVKCTEVKGAERILVFHPASVSGSRFLSAGGLTDFCPPDRGKTILDVTDLWWLRFLTVWIR